jgi:exodeoxyribonuclease VII large subunit
MTERYTVTSLVTAASQTMRRGFPRVHVVGEVSEFKIYGSGHAYFSIKDDAATLSCIMWKRERLEVPFEPRPGMEIAILGRLEIYPKNGRFQLIASALSPVGAGAQEVALQQLREKLTAEGVISPELRRQIPTLCRDIAVVTSPSGAVIRDILTVIDRRSGGLHITIYPCRVQGPEAPAEIRAALMAANDARPRHDVVILARGGGSAEDLSAFNTETVATALYETSIPVISAVGHETDFTLADDVADARAATPSQAAEMVSQDMTDVLQRVERMRIGLLRVPLCIAAARVELRRHGAALLGRRSEFTGSRRELEHRRVALGAYDPAEILRRGYAIVTGDHRPGSLLEIRMNNRLTLWARVEAEVYDAETS